MQSFDTSNVEDVINNAIEICPDAIIVVKSTVPVGYTEQIKNKYKINKREMHYMIACIHQE